MDKLTANSILKCRSGQKQKQTWNPTNGNNKLEHLSHVWGDHSKICQRVCNSEQLACAEAKVAMALHACIGWSVSMLDYQTIYSIATVLTVLLCEEPWTHSEKSTTKSSNCWSPQGFLPYQVHQEWISPCQAAICASGTNCSNVRAHMACMPATYLYLRHPVINPRYQWKPIGSSLEGLVQCSNLVITWD